MFIAQKTDNSIIIDDIVDREVRSRNFAGQERVNPKTNRVVNSEGRRNFILRLSPEVADELKARGCDVKMTIPQNPNDIPEPFVSVIVSYWLKNRPCQAESISQGVVTPIDEGHIHLFDSVTIERMILELEFGKKEKQHMDGTTYIPLYANHITCFIVPTVPSYIADVLGGFAPPAAPQVPMNDLPFKA